MFQPYTDSLKLFFISSSPPSYDPLKSHFLLHCPESHSQFLHHAPLWKNESFFIKLPFKFNEDINPTKATHPGMSPSDLLNPQLLNGLAKPFMLKSILKLFEERNA